MRNGETVERLIKEIQQSRGISKDNKQTMLSIHKMLRDNEHSASSHSSYLLLGKLLCKFLGRKNIKDATRGDIGDFLEKVRKRNFKEQQKSRNKIAEVSRSSMCYYKLILKSIYRMVFGMKRGEYPECVSYLNSNAAKNQLRKKDLLSVKEIEAMCRVTAKTRNIAIIKTLWETGARASEFLAIDLKDITIRKEEAEISIRTLKRKDGSIVFRNVLIIDSLPDLLQWLNEHPYRNNPESPLWVDTYTRKIMKRLSPESLSVIVKGAAEKAGITKRVWIHLFRHSRLTWLYQNGVSPLNLQNFAGWTNTGQIETYVHLCETDTHNNIREAHGIKKKESQVRLLKRHEICPSCDSENPINTRFCLKCNMQILTEEEQKMIESQEAVKAIAELDKLKPLLENMEKIQPTLEKLLPFLEQLSSNPTLLRTTQQLLNKQDIQPTTEKLSGSEMLEVLEKTNNS